MGQPEDSFRVPMTVGGMNIAFHDVVVHEPVDHIGAFAICGADHQGMPEEVALVDKGIGADPMTLPEVLE